ncbi:MAG TPA: sigma 54-interacting transcriptional regulator [Kiritimatiellia bacterium]|nr:sigma 54-interacting transcriptional regulator [Kiritimatiellia bacterium]HMO99909.1 sigma 54-interacting transcriptional regulator [Kiritimatiellia bacterium]HMP96050.1 sigma 54-interacting transcriptional regulator [Kiritimatiellia bacterium]
MTIPRILIIDDLFGREVLGGRNRERENLCAKYLLLEEHAPATGARGRYSVSNPIASASFCRAQLPIAAKVGDVVENSISTALEAIRNGWTKSDRKTHSKSFRWSMILLDLCFYTGLVTEESDSSAPGMPEGRAGDDDPISYFGLALLDAISKAFPELPVVILSSKPRSGVSMNFSRHGAVGFIDRSDPDGPELLRDALRTHGLLEDSSGGIVGRSLPLLLALREARRAALHRHHLLIGGERGSGKELLARYIHQNGGADRPFVPVNSAIFTPQLFSSEFFGIEAGTATGVHAKKGLIEAADGGDLFLDEVADLPDEAQAGILRVLQDGQFTRVGGKKPRKVAVRVIAATNSDVQHPDSGFRADLLDRLRTGGLITLPPLRERSEDIPLLAESIIREAEKAHRGARPREISEEALASLAGHDWPGNIRELRTVLFDAVNRYPDVEHLVPGHLRIETRSPPVPVIKLHPAPTQQPSSLDLSGLLTTLKKITFDSRNVSAWMGQLHTLQHAQTRVAARLLGAAVEATKRRTPDNPDGLIQIQPAAKLATGDASLTASKAADLFKRTLGPIADELEGDLLIAYQTSLRLRPRSTKARNVKA